MLDIHRFTPSRPDGVVCVAYRRAEPLDSMREVCGYPAGHPIHTNDTPSTAAGIPGALTALAIIRVEFKTWRGAEQLLELLDQIEAALLDAAR